MEKPRVLKFKNGDLVVAIVKETDVDGALWLHNPIMVVPFHAINDDFVGETFLLKPWIGISDDKDFMVRKSDIIVSCSLRENLLQQYKNYAEGETQDSPAKDIDLDMIRAKALRSKKLLN